VDFARSKELPFASLVSAVGSVRDVEFTAYWRALIAYDRSPLQDQPAGGSAGIDGPGGNIAPNAEKQLAGQFYILGSKSNGDVVGGRLVEAEVFTTCEIVLAEYLVQA